MLFSRTDRRFLISMSAIGGLITKRQRRIVLAAFGTVFLSCAVYGQNQPPPSPYLPITMQQAIDLARIKNPTLLSAQQNLLSIKAQEIQAGVRQNPNLVFTGSNVTLGTQTDNPYYYSAGVSRLFERGQKRRWRLDSARSTTAQTDAQYHAQEEQTILSVRQAFTSFVIAKTAKKIAEDNLSDFKHELDIARERLKAGDIAKLDFARLDLQLAQFESDESTAITNAQQASVQLQVLLGYDKPRKDFDVAGDVLPPVVSDSMEDMEQKALMARPDYHAAHLGVAVADANVKLAYANGTADPTLEADYDRNGNDNSVAFSFSVPLRLFDRNQGNKETSKYTAQASRFAEVAIRNQVVADVDEAWIGYTNAKVLSDRYNGHYLDEAKDVLDISRFSYEHGALALIDYLDAVRESRSVTADALNAYAQTWMAIHQLSFATATEVVP
jgi:cobalt-zinc-cadmium efflux system outer membrane protein